MDTTTTTPEGRDCRAARYCRSWTSGELLEIERRVVVVVVDVFAAVVEMDFQLLLS